MTTHKRFSPSGASRWLACPASTFGPQEEQQSSYADEGTAAHQLAAECWVMGTDPATRIGETINGFPVTEEMANAVQIFLDVLTQTVNELSVNGHQADVLIEHTMESSLCSDFGGTADAIVYGPEYLRIVDFKYGAGVAVEVEHNPQLKCYAWLSLTGLDCDPSMVCMTVVQPRRDHPDGPVRSWSTTAAEIRDFGQMVLGCIEAAEEGSFNVGDHCRWCPRKVHCPELQRYTLEIAKQEFADVQQTLTPEAAADLMEKAGAVESFLEAVKQWAHGQLDKGVPVPGFKLVHAFANRAYCVEESEILKRLKKLKVAKADAFVTSLKTPAQLEKVTGKEFVNSICDRALKGTTVVPESDKRPAVVRQSARDEFANLE